MVYEMIINSHFHVSFYYLKKFTEYPFIQSLEFYQFSSQIFSYLGWLYKLCILVSSSFKSYNSYSLMSL